MTMLSILAMAATERSASRLFLTRTAASPAEALPSLNSTSRNMARAPSIWSRVRTFFRCSSMGLISSKTEFYEFLAQRRKDAERSYGLKTERLVFSAPSVMYRDVQMPRAQDALERPSPRQVIILPIEQRQSADQDQPRHHA